jgi:hypothetical protein
MRTTKAERAVSMHHTGRHIFLIAQFLWMKKADVRALIVADAKGKN